MNKYCQKIHFITSAKIAGLLLAMMCLGFGIIYPHTSRAAAKLSPSLPKDKILTQEIEKISIKTETRKAPTTNIPLEPWFSVVGQNRKTILIKNKPGEIYKQIQTAAQKINSLPTNAWLMLSPSQERVQEFSPGEEGIRVDAVATTKNFLKIKNPLTENDIILPVVILSAPEKKLSATNSLGVNTLLARGVSVFNGSSKNRRTNIRVATEKMRGLLIAPGQNFSFNEYVGEVTAEDGFVPEIVIKKDGLKPELGGGVCQVSSTVFRAAVASGMPIIERKNHSFPVQHYAPQGTDATTYTGVVDLKFTNDTNAFILIWPSFPDTDTLIFDIYGTADERKVEVKDPVKYDFQTNGVFKTKWERMVKKPGSPERNDSFISTYLPAAWFKKEETFVSNASPTNQVPPSDNQTQENPNQPNVPQINN